MEKLFGDIAYPPPEPNGKDGKQSPEKTEDATPDVFRPDFEMVKRYVQRQQ